MHNPCLGAFVFALVVLPTGAAAQPAPAPATESLTFSVRLLRGYHDLQRDLAATAEKMPDEHYGFRPTPDIRPFGQLVAHVALAQFRTCAMLKGEPNPRKDEKEDASRTKGDAIALFNASTEYCDSPVAALTDPMVTEPIRVGEMQVAKGLLPVELIAHGTEMYGTMAVYLRLKGIVPPTTARQNQMKKSQ